MRNAIFRFQFILSLFKKKRKWKSLCKGPFLPQTLRIIITRFKKNEHHGFSPESWKETGVVEDARIHK